MEEDSRPGLPSTEEDSRPGLPSMEEDSRPGLPSTEASAEEEGVTIIIPTGSLLLSLPPDLLELAVSLVAGGGGKNALRLTCHTLRRVVDASVTQLSWAGGASHGAAAAAAQAALSLADLLPMCAWAPGLVHRAANPQLQHHAGGGCRPPGCLHGAPDPPVQRHSGGPPRPPSGMHGAAELHLPLHQSG